MLKCQRILRPAVTVNARVALRRRGLQTATRAFCSPLRSSRAVQKPYHWNYTRAFRTSATCHKAISFNLADIGEGIAEAEVLQWFVEVGDKVEEFDPICEVQSDKATVEITSRYNGTILRKHYEVGDMAKVQAPLVDIDQEGSGGESSADTTATKDQQTPTPQQPTPSSSSGATGDAEAHTAHHRKEPVNFVEVEKALATPAVRRIARENDIDLRTVPSSGKDGRVLKEDILEFLDNGGVTKDAQTAKSDSADSSTDTGAHVHKRSGMLLTREDTKIQVKGVQKAMVKSMMAANGVPHFTYGDELNMNNLITLRTQLKPIAAASGVSLSYLPFILKAMSLALNDYPMVNAHVNDDASEVIYKGAHNIRVAMDTPQGLLVPSVKNVQDLSIFEIAAELNRLQTAGAAGKLTTEDMSNGTISFSNIGAIGGTYMRPVLVCPEVAIAAIGRVMSVPRFDDKMEVYNAQIANISWSGDHRVLDGATMARFSNTMKSYVEDPHTMLMHMK
ncbi:hypothetical protein SARC_09976 [Sphaeroforma arctica JP610]|uniref:Dihydrolipoamide acetyltransferase component of pyruvate dehydrogenase complex n=1 Tax=Sphaeroforma arctica JP610 TaxID=667725 RepID=A0A0L0FLC1_9EUKA|nr:hypothetical protein SARC_09976 [Sphaeroforma arctica JP610]KNC77564.1 hypothetical protein SARC_09976 [Sphaeroforma arctica JP610]|eukprot:XP_014151466.1 hypothetical protein SARC_09976 [Sphaeroforma arctica JP610]